MEIHISTSDAEKSDQIRTAIQRVLEGRTEPWRVQVNARKGEPLGIQLEGPHGFARKHELFGVEHEPMLIAALLRGWLVQYDQEHPRDDAS